MFAENGLGLDMDAVNEVLRKGDLVTVGFTTFPERLLIDTRSNSSEGPLVAIVAPVATVQERYLWLGKHRGSFGSPEAFTFFVWPHTVRHLVEIDALAPIRERLAAVSREAEVAMAATLNRLLEIEHAAMIGAVTGDGEAWVTVWERPAAA
ncbi:MAG: hypothetical protein HYX53_11935 [Chloroflexi bacterium]|nr:hypothetical protein [Chloroflexota bacterium]